MKQMVATGMLLGILSACSTELKTGAELRAEAARADSSAAGYEVGPLMPSGNGGKTGAQGGRATKGQSDTPAASGPVGTRLAVGTAPPRDSQHVQRPAPITRDTTSIREPVTTPPNLRSGSVLPSLSPEREKDFLTADSARKIATFQLTAGDELADRVSFNGATRGARVLTIPLGWETRIVFVNRDPELPHSAAVIVATDLLPEELAAPAFPQARTVKVNEGLLEGDSDEIAFTASRIGRFFLACGVIGHAQRGQWLSLVVSDTVAKPSYR